MIARIKQFLKDACTTGIHFPFAHDPSREQPSATLMFFYISYMVANLIVMVSSTLLLIKGEYLTSTVAPTVMLVLGFIFYRLRNLDKVKIDLNDQEIELSSEGDGSEEKDKNEDN